MIISPELRCTAKALVELTTPTAEGLVQLGFDSGLMQLPSDMDLVATAKFSLPQGSFIDYNFQEFARLGDPPGKTVDGRDVSFSRIYALGFKTSSPVTADPSGSDVPWFGSPFPATGATVQSILSIGEFSLSSSQNSVEIAASFADAEIEIIAFGVES